jgi:iron complex outermembrane recepter protein
MNRSLKVVLYFATVLAVGAAAPGFAQAAAPSGASQDEGLTEIVVTARRSEERLQDVPISIAVFNQAQLEADLPLHRAVPQMESQFRRHSRRR